MQRQKYFNLNRREKNEPHKKKKTLQNIELNFLNKRQPPSKKVYDTECAKKKKKILLTADFSVKNVSPF